MPTLLPCWLESSAPAAAKVPITLQLGRQPETKVWARSEQFEGSTFLDPGGVFLDTIWVFVEVSASSWSVHLPRCGAFQKFSVLS